jgi:NAD(P)-dependent dehydrogenase (short-subunit alcohol dehydrogenase family)
MPGNVPSSEVANGFDVSGRIVWVTGSSRGIGRGVAEHFAREGARVVVHARTLDALADVTEALGASGAEMLAVAGDVRSEDDLAAAVAAIRDRFGRLDGVVACVGGAAPGLLADVGIERFRRQLDLNLTSAYATVRAAHPLLLEARGAAVLVSATAATSATPLFGAYGAAKAGVEHLTGSLAAEWGPEVRVNCVSPGLIATEGSMQAVFRGSEELAARAGRTTAVGRVGTPADIAHACHYLLSDAAAYVSGAVLLVDGGPTEGPTQRILRALEDPAPSDQK